MPISNNNKIVALFWAYVNNLSTFISFKKIKKHIMLVESNEELHFFDIMNSRLHKSLRLFFI